MICEMCKLAADKFKPEIPKEKALAVQAHSKCLDPGCSCQHRVGKK